jgi:hypothetical protein
MAFHYQRELVGMDLNTRPLHQMRQARKPSDVADVKDHALVINRPKIAGSAKNSLGCFGLLVTACYRGPSLWPACSEQSRTLGTVSCCTRIRRRIAAGRRTRRLLACPEEQSAMLRVVCGAALLGDKGRGPLAQTRHS